MPRPVLYQILIDNFYDYIFYPKSTTIGSFYIIQRENKDLGEADGYDFRFRRNSRTDCFAS